MAPHDVIIDDDEDCWYVPLSLLLWQSLQQPDYIANPYPLALFVLKSSTFQTKTFGHVLADTRLVDGALNAFRL